MIAALLLISAPLSLGDYRARLESIDAGLAQGRGEAAAVEARALLSAESIAGELAPDRYALEPIARGHPHRARLRALIASLAGATGASLAPPDRAAFERLQRAQQAALPREGGDLRPLPISQPPFFARVRDWLASAAEWAIDRVADFFRWLGGLFPAGDSPASGAGPITRLVFIGVGIIVVLVAALAARAILSPPIPRATAAAVRPAREDEDPLSRSASGWEERARALAAEGRAREAIRAWYHALLVGCYGAGALHYRRGSTNWEYAHALSPELGWRPRFEELTRIFDIEWYGQAESSAGQLQVFAEGVAGILAALRSRA